MKGIRHSEEQIIAIVRQGEAGLATAELCPAAQDNRSELLPMESEVRAATSDLVTMLSNGALTPPLTVGYSFKDFQEAVGLADGEAGQQKVLLDFSESR